MCMAVTLIKQYSSQVASAYLSARTNLLSLRWCGVTRLLILNGHSPQTQPMAHKCNIQRL